ncbi:MAG TPA: matrixin family metalloprotease [Burkholderiales bacterium]|nr:matrixin family metalloprotease [Burkholderiales bacterium]
MSLFRIAGVVAVGFAVWWFAFRVEGCGSAGALACGDKALDEGVGLSVPRAQACGAAGYYCFGRPETFQVVRWPLDKGKLKVRVTPPEFITDPELARKIRDAAVEGIREWDRQPFPLAIDTRKHAWPNWDIGMVWFHGAGGGHARVRYEQKGKRLEFAIEGIQVIVPPAEWRLTEAQLLDMVRATAMHEMGHALGLLHSDAERDIMFPQFKPGVTPLRPSERDLRTVEALYALPNGAMVQ